MRLKVGKIVNTHSLRGEVKVISSTDFEEERFKKGSKLLITRGNQVIEEVVVESYRSHKNSLLVKFEGIDSINEAEKFKNLQLKVDSENISELEENEFYFHEIIGCRVFDENNTLLGEVVEILTPGANDVWVIKGENGKEILIPYIADVVKNVGRINRLMKIDILTLFPDMFTSLNHSILGKARDKNILDINIVDYRKFSGNKHNQVDDYPFGGGQGMVLKPEPIFNAVESLNKTDKTRIILLCPQGERFNQKKSEELSKEDHLIFICGHYEGYDERIREYLVTDELSIGDFILTGGEFAAMTMVDSIARLIPDVLGKEESHKDDSFSTGLLEYPQYTRPKDYKGMLVPDVLTSGHHKNIEKYRMKESLRRTYIRRPDLLENYDLSEEEVKILDEIKKELRN